MKKYSVKSQIRDHSNKVPTSKDFKRSTNLSISSNVRVFRSFQINHIKQAGMFQTLEECFPKQFIHAKRREAIVLSITHWISNMKKTSLHKARAANLQRSKLCYIPFNTKYLLEANHLWHHCITFTSHNQYFLFNAPTIIVRTLCKQNRICWTPNWAPNSWLPNFSKPFQYFPGDTADIRRTDQFFVIWERKKCHLSQSSLTKPNQWSKNSVSFKVSKSKTKCVWLSLYSNLLQLFQASIFSRYKCLFTLLVCLFFKQNKPRKIHSPKHTE